MFRRRAALVVAALLVSASAVAVAAPAQAATIPVTIDPGPVSTYMANYPDFSIGSTTSTIRVVLPTETAGLGIDEVTWYLDGYSGATSTQGVCRGPSRPSTSR